MRDIEKFFHFFFFFRLFHAGEENLLFSFRLAECGHDEIGLWNECANFLLAFGENMERGGLHATSREAIPNFLPDESREIIADETIEDTPRFLCFAEIGIEFTWMGDRFDDSFLGDFIEKDALRILDSAAFGDMPRDSLSFAVGVGCEENSIGFFGERFDFPDDGIFAGGDLIMRDETSLDIDRDFI